VRLSRPEIAPRPDSRSTLKAAQADRLRRWLASIPGKNAFYSKKLASCGKWSAASDLDGLLDLLPFTTKLELEEDQAKNPPFGTNLGEPHEAYSRIHQTSGSTGVPLRWLDTPASWAWVLSVWDEVYRGAGVTAQDRVFFPFSFGPFLGFWAGFDAAARMGALVVPGGGLSSAARLRIARDVGATVLAATPTYALHLAETAQAEGIDLPRSGIRAIIVAGEPGGSVASTKRRIETEWGARVFDHCGMTEVGPFGFECLEAPGGVHVVESEFIVEVLDLRSGQVRRASDGAEPLEGELVLTNLGRTDSPLVRYRTGDVVRWSTAPCPCGRPWGRLLGGILGRVDDMIFLRGNNLYPSAVEGVIRQFADVMEFRIHARKVGAMAELEIEIELRPGSDPDALSSQVAGTIERDLLFRARVRAVPSGALPRFELKGQRFFKEGF